MTENIGGTKIPILNYPRLVKTSAVYIDQDFLDSYVEVLALGSYVVGDDSDAKDAAIVRGQIFIESLYYVGEKWWTEQILQWPRQNVYDKSGRVVDAENTPYDIFNAVAEASYQEYISPGILQPIEEEDTQFPLKRTKVKAGSVETEKEYETAGRTKQNGAALVGRLRDYLSHWIKRYGVSIPLIRT